jgi:hypothetical protein
MQRLDYLLPDDHRWSDVSWYQILLQVEQSSHQAIMRAAQFAVQHEDHAAEIVAGWKGVVEGREAEREPAFGLALLYVANEVVLVLAHWILNPGRLGRGRSCTKACQERQNASGKRLGIEM